MVNLRMNGKEALMVSWIVHFTRWSRIDHGEGADLAQEDQMAQQALDQKFGRWKWLVGLGPVALVCIAGLLHTAWPNRLTFRILMGSILLMVMDLVYTWYVIAAYRAQQKEKEEKEENNARK